MQEKFANCGSEWCGSEEQRNGSCQKAKRFRDLQQQCRPHEEPPHLSPGIIWRSQIKITAEHFRSSQCAKECGDSKVFIKCSHFFFAAFLFVFCWCMLIQLNKTRLGDASKVLNDVVIQRVRPRPCVVNASFTMIRWSFKVGRGKERRLQDILRRIAQTFWVTRLHQIASDCIFWVKKC